MTDAQMNGAKALVKALTDSGVEVCFANPGTSEMHFVAALDRVPGMRCVLGLFEGVVTGAADGYARMKDRPASTLLHLGPGLGNGLANLHNARKAQTPIVNIVGDHATYHVEHDAPLTADVEGIAWPVSAWVRTSGCSTRVSASCVARVSMELRLSLLYAASELRPYCGPAECSAVRPSSRLFMVSDRDS